MKPKAYTGGNITTHMSTADRILHFDSLVKFWKGVLKKTKNFKFMARKNITYYSKLLVKEREKE